MCFANGRCLLCIAFLVLFAALLILAVVHRVRAKKKVLALTPGERVRLLNELAEPLDLLICRRKTFLPQGWMPGNVTRDMRRNMIPWRWVPGW